MATWIAGKLSRPAIRQALGYLQERHPDSAITAQVARVATSDDPMAPSEEPPLSAPAGSSAKAAGLPPSIQQQSNERLGLLSAGSLRSRAEGKVAERAQRYVTGKAQTLVWQQVCLPLTLVLWVIALLSSWYEQHVTTSAAQTKDAAEHERDVARVVTAVRARPENAILAIKPSSKRVSHVLFPSRDPSNVVGPATALKEQSNASTYASTGKSGTRPQHFLDMSKLNRLLSIDTAASTCVVEAGMTFRDLLRATTHTAKLMPAVVPPFGSQTVGGAFVGSAISSTSGGFGSFAATVVEVEVILGSGELVRAGRQGPRADLFHALSGSYHTIGTVVALTLELIPAPRYVHQIFEICPSMDKAAARLQTVLDKRASAGLIGVEAVAFARDNITIAAVKGVDTIDTRKHKVLSFRHWHDQTYAAYLRHWSTLVAQRSVGKMPVKHVLPLADYLFRYEASSYWLGDFLYHLLPWPLTGASFVSRLLLGWSLSDDNLRSAFAGDRDAQMDLGRLRVLQDAHIPLAHAARFVSWTQEAIGVEPLWLCPVRASPQNLLEASFQHAAPGGSATAVKPAQAAAGAALYYLNVGMYGRPAGSHRSASGAGVSFSAEEVNEELVEQVYRAGGRTMLHAHNWHSPQLLAQMYDERSYVEVRDKYAATAAYEHLFDKVALRQADRNAMREPLEQPEKPLLNKLAKRLVMHRIGLSS